MEKVLENYLAELGSSDPPDVLAEVQAASVEAKLAGLVESAVEEAAAARTGGDPASRGRRCAFADGFSLHFVSPFRPSWPATSCDRSRRCPCARPPRR
jgi:hypothetical protein